MTLAVTFDDVAVAELAAAATWYHEQRPGLGERLIREVATASSATAGRAFRAACSTMSGPTSALSPARSHVATATTSRLQSAAIRCLANPARRVMSTVLVPSMLHEALVALFENRLALAAELLRDALGVRIAPWTEARREANDLNQLAPTEYRADLVVVLEDGASRTAVVVEVQLARDDAKRASWPVYVTTLRARLHCDVLLLVITPSPVVARWAREPIELGHPGFRLVPLVVSGASVPEVTDRRQARASPELAVLSALTHGRGDPTRAAAIADAALHAAASLDDERGRLYPDLVYLGLSEAVRSALEAMMIPKNYEYQSDFARKYYGQGKAEGEATGRVEGKADALLVLLAARGLTPSAEQRARIIAERAGACLDRWVARAVHVTNVGELWSEDDAS